MALKRAYLVEGGYRLRGEVTISGAKNAALPIMASCLLVEGPVVLENVPRVKDVETLIELLEVLGVKVIWPEGGSLMIDASELKDSTAPHELVRAMRASILVLGPLLARTGEARVSLPGGCAIGARPIDLHLKGLEMMGAEIKVERGYIQARAKRLKGTRIYLDVPTVTGTENLLMAAALAEGETVIENAAREPEVVDLAKALKEMGVEVEGEGTGIIKVRGIQRPKPFSHKVIPDRIEAGTFMVAAAISNGNVTVKGTRAEHLEAVLGKLREAGIEVDEKEDSIRVSSWDRPRAVDVRTAPYPGFPTDMQAQFMALMSIARGLCVITETIFENRFLHVNELRRMGADIRLQGQNAVVQGVPYLTGAPVMATDLRAGASLVIAGLVAEGETLVGGVHHLERGYERFLEKLSALGARVKEVEHEVPEDK